MSDLHLEYGSFSLPETDANAIVLAGDIHLGTKAVNWIKEQTDKPVIYIAGNHEYYGKKNTFPDLQDKIRDECKESNIHFLENETVEINGVTFLGCSLWTDFNLHKTPRLSMYDAEVMMNDYKVIKAHINKQRRKLRAIDTLQAHQNSKACLSKQLTKNNSTTVIVTHHAPSNRSNAAKYRESAISAAFASNLEDFIKEYEPPLWIHGHMHNSSDYMLDKTRVVCNPRGYSGFQLNRSFNPLLTIDLEVV